MKSTCQRIKFCAHSIGLVDLNFATDTDLSKLKILFGGSESSIWDNYIDSANPNSGSGRMLSAFDQVLPIDESA